MVIWNFILGFSLGMLFIKNELNQNLLHLAAMYGSLKCLSYIVYFNLLSPHDLDIDKTLPLLHAITQLKTDDPKNRGVIAVLLKITDVTKISLEGIDLMELMTEWQKEIFYNYKDIYIATE